MSVDPEFPFAFGPDATPDPQGAMEALILGAETRFMEALDRQHDIDGLIWYGTEETEQGEQLVFFRLLNGNEDKPDVERFDVGIVVQDNKEDRPRPTYQAPDERHFYVRVWKAFGQITQTVTPGNALEYIEPDGWNPDSELIITNLRQKIDTYPMTIMRTRHDPPRAA